jgi:hypothetical protein
MGYGFSDDRTCTIEGTNATIEPEVWAVSDDGKTLTKERQTTDWRGTRNERSVFRRSAERGERVDAGQSPG